MTLAVFKKNIKKFGIWSRQHWRWLLFSLAVLFAYVMGSRNKRALLLQAQLAKKQYQREAAMLDREHREAAEKIKKAQDDYKSAITKLDARLAAQNSKLEQQKVKEYKRMLKSARNNPDELDRILQGMGIERDD